MSRELHRSHQRAAGTFSGLDVVSLEYVLAATIPFLCSQNVWGQ